MTGVPNEAKAVVIERVTDQGQFLKVGKSAKAASGNIRNKRRGEFEGLKTIKFSVVDHTWLRGLRQKF